MIPVFIVDTSSSLAPRQQHEAERTPHEPAGARAAEGASQTPECCRHSDVVRSSRSRRTAAAEAADATSGLPDHFCAHELARFIRDTRHQRDEISEPDPTDVMPTTMPPRMPTITTAAAGRRIRGLPCGSVAHGVATRAVDDRVAGTQPASETACMASAVRMTCALSPWPVSAQVAPHRKPQERSDATTSRVRGGRAAAMHHRAPLSSRTRDEFETPRQRQHAIIARAPGSSARRHPCR